MVIVILHLVEQTKAIFSLLRPFLFLKLLRLIKKIRQPKTSNEQHFSCALILAYQILLSFLPSFLLIMSQPGVAELHFTWIYILYTYMSIAYILFCTATDQSHLGSHSHIYSDQSSPSTSTTTRQLTSPLLRSTLAWVNPSCMNVVYYMRGLWTVLWAYYPSIGSFKCSIPC